MPRLPSTRFFDAGLRLAGAGRRAGGAVRLLENTDETGRVAVLLATQNGALYLQDQLQSLVRQTHPAIDVHVSDDNSTDGTMAILRDWASGWPKGRFVISQGPGRGFAENFRALLVKPGMEASHYAFCDQDDVWEPGKLERAIGWIGAPSDTPKLFCSRTKLISEEGRETGHSALFSRQPSFRNALVQSIAGGNTMVFNRAAHRLLAKASSRSSFVSHDWWAYLIVSGAGGEVRYSPEPLVRYRQHRLNMVGANTTVAARFSRLRRLLRGQFSLWTQVNIAGLEANRDLLTDAALADYDQFRNCRAGSLPARLRSLRASGVYRQSSAGDIALYIAVLSGRL